MARNVAIIVALLALSAWAGAQPPTTGLSAADHLRLHRANRTLLVDLVDSSVRLGTAAHPLARAEGCQGTAKALGIAFRKAAEGGDADRVAELGDHLSLIVREGLVPVLDEGKRTIPAGSPDAVKLQALRETAAADLAWAQSALPSSGKLVDNDRARSLRGKLDELHDQLK